jgi:hypothetical protein
MGLLEAVEYLLSTGYKPTHTYYFGKSLFMLSTTMLSLLRFTGLHFVTTAFGHDEEISGFAGAGQIASYLSSQRVHLEYLIDEGTPVLETGNAPFLDKQLALIGSKCITVVPSSFITCIAQPLLKRDTQLWK